MKWTSISKRNNSRTTLYRSLQLKRISAAGFKRNKELAPANKRR